VAAGLGDATAPSLVLFPPCAKALSSVGVGGASATGGRAGAGVKATGG